MKKMLLIDIIIKSLENAKRRGVSDLEKQLSTLFTKKTLGFGLDAIKSFYSNTINMTYSKGRTLYSPGVSCFLKWLYNEVKDPIISRGITKIKTDGEYAYIILPGSYYSLYKKCIMVIVASKNDTDETTITTTIYGSDKDRKNVLREIKVFISRMEIKGNAFFANQTIIPNISYKEFTIDDRYVATPGRDIRKIFSYQKQEVIDIIERFQQMFTIYHTHGINYKTGILLYGHPGTGKTSLIKAIATEFAYPILSVNVTKINSKNIASLKRIISVPDPMIIVLEEIDCSIVTDQKEKDERISDMLTLLDGAGSLDNKIIFATTNYFEKVPYNIKRGGRFDNIIEMKGIDEELAIQLCNSFDCDFEEIKNSEKFKNDSSVIISTSEDGKIEYSPAEIQKHVLNNFSSKMINNEKNNNESYSVGISISSDPDNEVWSDDDPCVCKTIGRGGDTPLLFVTDTRPEDLSSCNIY